MVPQVVKNPPIHRNQNPNLQHFPHDQLHYRRYWKILEDNKFPITSKTIPYGTQRNKPKIKYVTKIPDCSSVWTAKRMVPKTKYDKTNATTNSNVSINQKHKTRKTTTLFWPHQKSKPTFHFELLLNIKQTNPYGEDVVTTTTTLITNITPNIDTKHIKNIILKQQNPEKIFENEV